LGDAPIQAAVRAQMRAPSPSGVALDGRLGGHTNGRCRGDDGCRYPAVPA